MVIFTFIYVLRIVRENNRVIFTNDEVSQILYNSNISSYYSEKSVLMVGGVLG